MILRAADFGKGIDGSAAPAEWFAGSGAQTFCWKNSALNMRSRLADCDILFSDSFVHVPPYEEFGNILLWDRRIGICIYDL